MMLLATRWWEPACGGRKPYMVGHDITPPRVARRVEPAWPKPHVKGIVIVETVITEAGDVCAARVLKTPSAAMGAAAVRAVTRWRFVPARKGGRAVAVVFDVAVGRR